MAPERHLTHRRGRPVAVAAVLVAAITVGALLATGGGGRQHKLFVVLPEAAEMISGQQIRAAGQPVGSIGSIEPVERGRAARVELDFGDQAWPLPQGSTMALRWGGTVSFSNRYIALTRASGGPPIPAGATLPARDFTLPVEFDSVTTIFTPTVRQGTKALLDSAGPAFAASRSPLSAALGTAPPAVAQASDVLRALQQNQGALNTLLRSTDRVTQAVDTADPGIGQLLAGAGTTFAAIASQARNLQTTLDRMTPALAQTRTTLAHANRTLTAAGTLTDRLAPGVVQLDSLAQPLSDVLQTVVNVGPDARSTLASLRAATPSLNPLLTEATRLMPTVGSIGSQSVNELQCIRPYTPDIVSLFSNWGDFFSYVDNKDKFARVIVDNIPAAENFAGYDSATAVKLFPGLQYAFPRPPGLAAGQPWFLPQCGAGPDSLDPSKDPEARR